MTQIRVMEIKRVFDILEKLKLNSTKKDVLNIKVNKQWVHCSAEEFILKANYVSSALIHIGLLPKDIVAVMAGNMPKWNFVDYGSQQVNMPTAPIFPTLSNDDLKYILNHCEAKIIFISDKATYQKVLAIKNDLIHLKHIYSFNEIEGVHSFDDFVLLGEKHFNATKLQAIKDSVLEDDLLTILYTSGTTGQPKGVMLSHKNLVENVKITQNLAPFTNKWRALSFLPLNHVYERFLNTMYLFHDVSIYYAENFETIGDNCRELHPEMFVAVPRILERVLEKICAAGDKLTGFKKHIFNWSLKLAERFELHGANGPWYAFQRKIADKLVYKKWREAVGGNIVAIASGGAALNPRIERIFYCAGLNLLQGYGLTETCVVVSINRFDEDNRMFGTTGVVVENSQVKIADEDGEILMKGPSLMLGYYKNPEATAEVIDSDGWFHTGDVGVIIDSKFLKITDRKKELFKTSSGKYISPIAIENKLKESKYIEQCMVVGSGQKYASAIIIPSILNFKDYFSQHNLVWPPAEDICLNEVVKKIIAEHVKKVNATLAPYEQLKRHQLITAVWGIETGEITPKLSLKRKIIHQKHLAVINKIFGED